MDMEPHQPCCTGKPCALKPSEVRLSPVTVPLPGHPWDTLNSFSLLRQGTREVRSEEGGWSQPPAQSCPSMALGPYCFRPWQRRAAPGSQEGGTVSSQSPGRAQAPARDPLLPAATELPPCLTEAFLHDLHWAAGLGLQLILRSPVWPSCLLPPDSTGSHGAFPLQTL